MTDHQKSVRIVSEEIDVRLLVKMSRLAVKHVSSILKDYVQKYKLIS